MTDISETRDRFVAIEDDIRATDEVAGVVVFAGEDGMPEELQVFVESGTDRQRIRTRIGRVLARHGAAAGVRRVYVFTLAPQWITADDGGTPAFELEPDAGDAAEATDPDVDSDTAPSVATGRPVVREEDGALARGGREQTEAPASPQSVAVRSPGGRVTLRTVLLEAGHEMTDARVALGRGKRDRAGTATASATSHNLRVSAAATIEALADLLDEPDRFALVGAALVEAMDRRIVCVVVEDQRRDTELVGACTVGEAPVHEAAVRATLDAVNRQV